MIKSGKAWSDSRLITTCAWVSIEAPISSRQLGHRRPVARRRRAHRRQHKNKMSTFINFTILFVRLFWAENSSRIFAVSKFAQKCFAFLCGSVFTRRDVGPLVAGGPPSRLSFVVVEEEQHVAEERSRFVVLNGALDQTEKKRWKKREGRLESLYRSHRLGTAEVAAAFTSPSTHSNTHTHALSLSLTRTHTHTLSHAHKRSLSFSLWRTHTLSMKHVHARTHSLFLMYTHTRTPSLVQVHTHSLTHNLYLCQTHTHTLSLSHSIFQARIHFLKHVVLSRTLSLKPAHTLSHCLSLSKARSSLSHTFSQARTHTLSLSLSVSSTHSFSSRLENIQGIEGPLLRSVGAPMQFRTQCHWRFDSYKHRDRQTESVGSWQIMEKRGKDEGKLETERDNEREEVGERENWREVKTEIMVEKKY